MSNNHLPFHRKEPWDNVDEALHMKWKFGCRQWLARRDEIRIAKVWEGSLGGFTSIEVGDEIFPWFGKILQTHSKKSCASRIRMYQMA